MRVRKSYNEERVEGSHEQSDWSNVFTSAIAFHANETMDGFDSIQIKKTILFFMSTTLGAYHHYAHLAFMSVEGEAHYPTQIDQKKLFYFLQRKKHCQVMKRITVKHKPNNIIF